MSSEALGRPSSSHLPTLLAPPLRRTWRRLAQQAREVTLQRFGRAVRLFAPLYVSNACLSSCTYCGFSKELEVNRRTLTVDEVVAEAQTLAEQGFRHILLVSGEHRIEVSKDYLVACVEALRPLFPSISIETQTWSDDTYARLVEAGLEGVVHYQETYDRARYAEVHRAGWKRDYDRRLREHRARGRSRACGDSGSGCCSASSPDWRADVVAVAEHALWLQRTYWRTEVTVSLPRIKASASGFQPAVPVSDADYVQAMAALRLVAPEVGIVLSTREPAALRDGLATDRGDDDERRAARPSRAATCGRVRRRSSSRSATSGRRPQVAAMLAAAGYEPVWKDAFALR